MSGREWPTGLGGRLGGWGTCYPSRRSALWVCFIVAYGDCIPSPDIYQSIRCFVTLRPHAERIRPSRDHARCHRFVHDALKFSVCVSVYS